MIAGATPNATKSHRESNYIPKLSITRITKKTASLS